MIRRLAHRIRSFLLEPLAEERRKSLPPSTAVEQKLLACNYRLLLASGAARPTFGEAGFRVHSQFDEDGILLFIFALIGATNRKCVEVCAGDGRECNTANLILNHRWIGLLVDGKERNVNTARDFYARHPDSRYWPPVIVQSWITRENINGLLADNGFTGEIDLLSLDIDGIDYWLWQGLTAVQPRVVVLEFNHLWGPERSVSVPYDPEFKTEFAPHGADYYGASLAAFVKLGREKGYGLVGTNAIATNAFFIRNDIPCAWLPEVDPRDCFGHPRAAYGMQHRLPNVLNRAWVEV